MAVTHAGLLEHRSHLGVANTLTLVRANLPTMGSPLGSGIGVVAAMTDFADGELARRTGTETRFGTYADAFADAAFWIWYASVHGNCPMRWAAWLTWLGPTLAVTVRSVARGEMVEPPRPRVIRPAASLQVVLAVYGLVRVRATDRPARRRRTRTRLGL